MTGTVLGMKCDVKSNLPSSSMNRTQVFVLLSFALILVIIFAGTVIDVCSSQVSDVYNFGETSTDASSTIPSTKSSSWHLSKSLTATSLPFHEYSPQELQRMMCQHNQDKAICK